MPIGTLASNTAIKETTPLPLDDDFQMESFKTIMGYTGGTASEGPVYIGLSDGDYTVAEIAEYFNNSGPRGISDRVEQEVAGRAIIPLGMLHPGGASQPILWENAGFGVLRKVVGMWLSDVSSPTWFAYNDDDAALTNNAKVQGFVRYKGKWA